MFRPPFSAGFTLVELCVLLVLFALLSAMAVPSLTDTFARARGTAAMNRLAGDVFLARSLASRSGQPVLIRFEPSSGCADHYAIAREDGVLLRRVAMGLEDTGVCLGSNVARAMRVNSRGMLIGSPRKLYVRSGRAVDSATISIVGRVYRWP
jgi:type II secretory pathway pseudopilin PulG